MIMTAPQNVEHAVYLPPTPTPQHTHFEPLHKSTNNFFWQQYTRTCIYVPQSFSIYLKCTCKYKKLCNSYVWRAITPISKSISISNNNTHTSIESILIQKRTRKINTLCMNLNNIFLVSLHNKPLLIDTVFSPNLQIKFLKILRGKPETLRVHEQMIYNKY